MSRLSRPGRSSGGVAGARRQPPRRRSRSLLRAAIRGYKPNAMQLASRLRQRAKPRPIRGLGELRSLDPVHKELKQALEKGQVLPGDKWPLEYQRWIDGGKKGPAPGVLTGDQLDLFECRYNGDADACCRIEWRSAAETSDAKVPSPIPNRCKSGSGWCIPAPKEDGTFPKSAGRCPDLFPKLTSELREHYRYIHRNVFSRLDTKTAKPTPGAKVDLLFLYGCKRISRLMPGFAKVVKRRIIHDVSMMGKWTKPFKLEEEKKSGSTPGAPPEYKPPPPVEIVEICTIRHRQLDATLRRDLELIVAHDAPGGGAADRVGHLIDVVSLPPWCPTHKVAHSHCAMACKGAPAAIERCRQQCEARDEGKRAGARPRTPGRVHSPPSAATGKALTALYEARNAIDEAQLAVKAAVQVSGASRGMTRSTLLQTLKGKLTLAVASSGMHGELKKGLIAGINQIIQKADRKPTDLGRLDTLFQRMVDGVKRTPESILPWYAKMQWFKVIGDWKNQALAELSGKSTGGGSSPGPGPSPSGQPQLGGILRSLRQQVTTAVGKMRAAQWQKGALLKGFDGMFRAAEAARAQAPQRRLDGLFQNMVTGISRTPHNILPQAAKGPWYGAITNWKNWARAELKKLSSRVRRRPPPRARSRRRASRPQGMGTVLGNLRKKATDAVQKMAVEPWKKALMLQGFNGMFRDAEQSGRPQGELHALFANLVEGIRGVPDQLLPGRAKGEWFKAIESWKKWAFAEEKRASRVRAAAAGRLREQAKKVKKVVDGALKQARAAYAAAEAVKPAAKGPRTSSTGTHTRPSWLTLTEKATAKVGEAASSRYVHTGTTALEAAHQHLRNAVAAVKEAILWTDLGPYDQNLKGERFDDIAERLLSFYRKAGVARYFERAQTTGKEQVRSLAQAMANSPAGQSPDASDEIGEHTNKTTIDTRSQREMLRRKVDQWTYGYEYTELASFLRGPAPPQLFRDYRNAEREVIGSFWNDCLEIQTICHQPKTGWERQKCRECAERAVREHCIDGSKQGKCRGLHRAVVVYRGTDVAYATSVFDLKAASGPLSDAQMKKATADRLNKNLEYLKGCFIENKQFRRYPFSHHEGPKGVFALLKGYAKRGELTKFQDLYQNGGFMVDCFQCNCGHHAGCRNHYGGPRWHTLHEHCSLDCAGMGFLAGACRGVCAAGHNFGAWANAAWKKLFGGAAGGAKAGLTVQEFHDVRVGDEPVWSLEEKLAGCKKSTSRKPGQSQTQCEQAAYQDSEKNWKTDVMVHRWVSLGNGRNTYLNWLALQVIANGVNFDLFAGTRPLDPKYHREIVEFIINRIFMPQQVVEEKGLNHRGKEYFNSLPMTEWQRCYLWSKEGASCNQRDAKGTSGGVDWTRFSKDSPLFKMVFEHPDVKTYLDQYHKFWKVECPRKDQVQLFSKTGQTAAWNCAELGQRTRANAAQFLTGKDPAEGGGANLGSAADAVGQAAEPIVGKLLGIVLKQAGIFQMMKALAQAAGLTPEQSADCEDPEYRHEILKIKECAKPPKADYLNCQDHKRGCLLKIFAKNFGTVLESIIVMLGNRLVDWGVDMMRNLLQPLKKALVAAAGSVPFAGGVLAALVDIAWELLMNYAAKAILKNFVIAKLPQWMKIREMSKDFERALEREPILQLVAGIVLQLLNAAMVHGDKSWMAVGVNTVLSGIQAALQLLTKGKQSQGAYFWLRALAYAKKEMVKRGGGPGEGLGAQIIQVVQNMVEGFKQAIARGIDNESTKANFILAVDEVKKYVSDPMKLMNQLQGSEAIQSIATLIGKNIGPVVIPVVTTFVKMDPWVKGLLYRIGDALVDVLRAKGRTKARDLVERVVDILEPSGKACSERVICRLLERLPVGDPDLRTMLIKGLDILTAGLRDIDALPKLLEKPATILKGVAELTGDFIIKKAGELVPAHLGPEKTLVESAVGKIIQVLKDEGFRQKLFAGGPAGEQTLMRELAEVVRPYAKARLGELAAGTGLEGLVKDAVDGLLGKQGPFYRGAAFFTDLKKTLGANASQIAGSVFGAVAGIVDTQAKRLGAGPILGSIAKGVLGVLRKALQTRAGLTGVLGKGAAGVLGLAKDAFAPLLNAIAPKGQGGALLGLIRKIVGGVLDLLGKPGSLQQLARQGAAALKGLAKKVATGLRDAVKSVIAGHDVLPKALQQLAGRAIDGFFKLLSNPSEIAKLEGAKVLALLKDVGAELFNFVKDKIGAAVAKGTGQTPKAIQAMVTSVLGQVQKLIADPSRLRSMVEGAATEVIATATQVLSEGARALIDSAVPRQVRGVVQSVVQDVLGFLANPSRLAGLAQMKAGDLLGKLAPAVKGLLQGILESAVPPQMLEQVKTAIGQVQAALANPAGLAAQAGAAARKAIDEVIAAALVRIPDAGLRGLASNLVALVRDLVSTGTPAQQLRTEVKALFGRLVTTGKQFLASLLPGGPIQQLVTRAVDGLHAFLTNPRGVAAALAQKAKALLPGVWRALVGFLQDSIRDAIPDRRASTLVSGLVEEIVGMIGDPTRWQGLTTRGVGYFFSRLLPVARDFAFSVLAEATGVKVGALRGLVEGLLQAASRLFSSPEAIQSFAKNAVSSLVSLGVNSVAPAVLSMVEQATGSKDLGRFLRTAFDGLAGILREPAKLGVFLKMQASQAFGLLLGHAEKLVVGLVDGLVKEPGLKELAQDGLRGVLAYVRKAAAGSGGDLFPAVKAILEKLVPAVTKIVSTKLQGLFPPHLKGLGDVVAGGLKKLTDFATNLVKDGKAAWTKLTAGGGKMFGKIVNAVLPLLLGPIKDGLRNSPEVQALVGGLLGMVQSLLADPRQLQNPEVAKKLILPELGKALRSFVQKAVVDKVPKGIPQALVAVITDAGLSLLEPKNLSDFIGQLQGGGKGLIKLAVGGLKKGLAAALDKLTQRNQMPGFVKILFNVGLDKLAETLQQ